MKKKLIIKRKSQNEYGEMIESIEEITSDSPEFSRMFDEMVKLHNKMSMMDTMDFMKIIDPSNN